MRHSETLLVVLFLLAVAFAAPAYADSDPKTAISGSYLIDPDHTSVTFKIDHLGFSHYTGRFDKAEGTLDFNSANPDKSALDVTIYPNSIDTNNVKLEEELRGDKWFDVIKFPRATFHVTKIDLTSATTGKITGDLTLKGQTHSITLDATFVGSGAHPFTEKQVIGFSATGKFRRADFGISNLLPMIGDDVTLSIETEFDKSE